MSDPEGGAGRAHRPGSEGREHAVKKTIAMQSISRSQLDQSRLCSFDQEVTRFPTKPLIHMDARLLLVRGGAGRLRIQSAEYPLKAGSLAAILPWQISEITQVEEPLRYYLIAFHFDTIHQALRLFLGEDGQPLPIVSHIDSSPVAQLSSGAAQDAQYIADALRRELGMESTLGAAAAPVFSGIQTVSLLIQLLVLFLRSDAACPEAAADGTDYRDILRYMYLHCGEKLTLQTLADVFYCSRATVSAHINAMTGLSFFDLLNEMRIGKTANYLLYTDLTLKELAEILGYVDESHISKVFAARLGMRISDYRKTYQRVENICQLDQSRLGYGLVNYIYRNYMQPLSAKEVARRFGISVVKLHQTLLCQVEYGFEDFLNLVRVNRACEKLLSTHQTVLEIAIDVGYHNAKTLNRNFLKYRQMTPSAYRSAMQSAGPGGRS